MTKIVSKPNRLKVKEKVGIPKAIEAYMPLVYSIASMVSGKGLPPSIDYNDLVSDGIVGLMKAWEGFDPKRGVKFETYASYRVRGEILDGLRNYNPVPYRVQVMIRDMAKGKYPVPGKVPAGLKPSEVKLLEKKELTEVEFKKALAKLQKIVSASALMYLLSLEALGETTEVEIPGEKSQVEELELSELKGRLRVAIEDLPELEKKVVELFYKKDMTQRRIAQHLRLSRPKVNRILGKVITKLKRRLVKEEVV